MISRGPYLGTRGPSEVRVAHRPVHAEIRPVERIESVGAELQAKFVAIAGWPDGPLLHHRNIVHQHRRLPEIAVVLRRRAE